VLQCVVLCCTVLQCAVVCVAVQFARAQSPNTPFQGSKIWIRCSPRILGQISQALVP